MVNLTKIQKKNQAILNNWLEKQQPGLSKIFLNNRKTKGFRHDVYSLKVEYLNALQECPKDLILNAFSWLITKQGWNFWDDLNRIWIMEKPWLKYN